MSRRVVSIVSIVLLTVIGVLVPVSPPVSAAVDGSYVGLTPTRILDTRDSSPIGPGAVRNLKVTGVGGVPADGVGAVALNVTVTGSSSPTFVTVFPSGEERPTASNVNVASAGDTVANSVIALVGDGGEVSIFNGVGTTDLIVDVAGWFPADGEFSGLVPDRILDTRDRSALPAGGARTLDVTGVGGVPADGVGAVVLNVTATEAVGPTFVTVYPSGAARPTASNVNVSAAGDTVANLVIATVGDGGEVSISNGPAASDVIVDVAGWFPAGGAYSGLVPERIMDTRDTSALGRNGVRTLEVTGVGGVPADGVGAVVLNVTATEAVGPTFVTVFPTGAARPTASNVNVSSAGDTVANLVIATVGDGGTVSIANGPNGTDVIVDVAGWFPAAATPDPDPDPDPDPEPTGPSGVLWGSGNSTLWRFELGTDQQHWEDFGFQYDIFSVNEALGQFIRVEESDPFDSNDRPQVSIQAIETFSEKAAFKWPTGGWDGLDDVGMSDDREFIFLRGTDSDYETWLEVMDRQSRTIELTLNESVGEVVDATWTPAGNLVVAFDMSENPEAPYGAAIVEIDRSFIADPEATAGVTELITFTEAQGLPGWLDVSPDGSTLVFSRSGIWTMPMTAGATPTSIATSSYALGGSRFSPDGEYLALTRFDGAGFISHNQQYIIPSDPDTAIVLTSERGDEYIFHREDDTTLVGGIEAWFPAAAP